MTLHIVYYLKDNKRELNGDIVENNIFPGIVKQEKKWKKIVTGILVADCDGHDSEMTRWHD